METAAVGQSPEGDVKLGKSGHRMRFQWKFEDSGLEALTVDGCSSVPTDETAFY
jgi:hypothetical protein